MADEKKVEAKKEKTVVILNRGLRTFHVHTGKVLKEAIDEKAAEMEIVLLRPQGSVEVQEKYAKELLGYPDLIDAAKAAPEQANKLEAAEAENQKLKAELAEMKGKKGDK